LIVATTWYWFLIPLAAISGPMLFRWRLVRMRRRRQQLRSSEWMGEIETPGPRESISTVADARVVDGRRGA
jgi:hypothetical protein